MKKMARLMLATLVLLSAVSISSFADGGAPTPLCSPGHCGSNKLKPRNARTLNYLWAVWFASSLPVGP